MSLFYKLEGAEGSYSVSYRDLKTRYEAFCNMTDEEFVSKLPEALHLACIIGFFKEMNSIEMLSDAGLIHLIAHQLHIPDATKNEFRQLRKSFELLLKLA